MAHYTTADQIDLTIVARRYGLTGVSIAPLSGGAANSSFRLGTEQGDYVLTSLDNHDEESATILAGHTQALHGLGLPTSEVVLAMDGSLVIPVGDRLLVLKKWIAGTVQQPLPLALLTEAGDLLARLHALAPNAEGLDDVPVAARRLSLEHLAAIPDFDDQDFAQWLTSRLGHVRDAEADNLRAPCLVHGDLFDDNLIVRDDGGLSVLDWETISLDDPLLDLGMAAVGLAQDEAGLLATERLHALLDGYEKTRPLTAGDRAILPLEIEHAALIIAFHRYHRHNVRFPNPERATYHRAMVRFTESVAHRV
ncbi:MULTISPECIES: phosphotransferase [Streptomyces]|uniref:phosphotransferase n=1 Tax=Streptomyces TaxID=1883 RepID=UPI00039B217F|nr:MULTISPECIES: phosphotransferase [Streptomyces]MBZ6114577.1 phosphotransferase [Streptomyces olivaceus]MBZ6128434.1 phosphotransferase [Streptomyces olivaceus]MBZ6149282.1 phosphotransferase [Streptomyces olivaceus]MBZ6163198.1 phosphotransferase [Streptomyces olivaceus]MBZ6191002.1 phosphotransferase [Streptomyces olivaceus]